MSAYIEYLLNEFFSSPVDFLFYMGGAGGEHLAINLKLYSDIYCDDSLEYYQDNYRWILHDNPFLSTITAESGVSEEPYYNLIYDRMVGSGLTDTDIALHIQRSIAKKPTIHRKHLSNGSVYTDSNTILLYQSTESWKRYCALLFAYKTASKELDGIRLHHYITTANFLQADIKQKILNSGLTRMNTAMVHLISSGEDVSNMSLDDALRQYAHNTLSKVKFTDDHFKKFTRRIEFMQLWDIEFMNEFFQINNPIFHDNMRSWHTQNLQLLTSKGHDIDEWRIE